MSYDSLETSIESGQPIECYRFIAGSMQRFYTSAEDEQTIGAQAYTPKAIQRGNVSEGQDKRESDFSVTLPTSDDIAQLFVGTLPGVRVQLTVFRFHRGDGPTPETIVVFNGYVHGVSYGQFMKESTLNCRPGLSSGGRQVPPRTYQASCNFVLYDPDTCKADPTSPVNRATAKPVVSQVGNVLTVSGLGAYPSGWFTAGMVEADGGLDVRTVLEDDGAGNLTLMWPFASLPTIVDVLAGCDHTGDGAAGCAAKHDNIPNNGGFMFVPKKNAFETGLP